MSFVIQLNQYHVNACKKFAAARAQDSAWYKAHGGFKPEDILAGAMGELGAYKLLKSQDIDVGRPDFSIHSVKQKSFSADLSDGACFYHVKSQTAESERRYGRSWLLNRRDPLLNKELVNHYLILTTVDIPAAAVNVHFILDINAIIDKSLIGECRLNWFRRDKVAIYADDLERGLTNDELHGII